MRDGNSRIELVHTEQSAPALGGASEGTGRLAWWKSLMLTTQFEVWQANARCWSKEGAAISYLPHGNVTWVQDVQELAGERAIAGLH